MFLLAVNTATAGWAQDSPTKDDFSSREWSVHFQITFLPQYHGPFPASYSGANSLSSNSELNMSFTATIFLGLKAWDGGFLYADPELPAGSGFSHVTGIGDFPNGEISKVGSEAPTFNQARVYFQQVFGLGGEKENMDDDQNQVAYQADVSRLTFVAGKIAMGDFFDGNAYSHDARTQFMNLAFVGNSAWDFAADTHGYTLAVYGELNQKTWAFRFAEAMVSTEANGSIFDENLAQAHSENAEVEWRYGDGDGAGKLRLLGFINHAHMGSYQEALDASPINPDVNTTQNYRDKYGFGIDWEQRLGQDLGVFARLGWNDGQTQTWMYTAVDEEASLGLSLKGNRWGRNNDQAGLAFAIAGLSSVHQAYLAAGGADFDIGDGALNYAPEEVVELYYLFKPIQPLGLTLDFQGVNNPAYNQDRGPVAIIAGRAHLEI